MNTDSLAGVTNPLRHVWIALLLTTMVATATGRQNGLAEHPAQPYRGRVEAASIRTIRLESAISFLNTSLFTRTCLRGCLPKRPSYDRGPHTGRPRRNRIILLADDARNYTGTTKEYAAKIVKGDAQQI
jgi:hypothetical protein